MGSTELCLQCRGNSLAWLPCLQLHKGGGEEEEEEEEREGEKNQYISIGKVTATFKIIRQIHLFYKCLHFQMPLFGALCCHCP